MKLGFLSSMAALLAGAGLALGQEYQYVQGGSLPARSLPAGAVVMQEGAAPASNGSVPVAGNSTYDCLGCGSGCGAGGCGIGGCAAGFCNNTTELCNGCDPYTFYGRAELLIWNIQRVGIPNLSGFPVLGILNVDDGVTPVFQVPVFAVIDGATLPDANSRIGGEHLGARLTGGVWLDSTAHCGLEVSAFVLESRSSNIAAGTGLQVVNPADDNAIIVQNPGGDNVLFFFNTGTGTIAASIRNELWGIEVNGRCGRYSIGCFSFGCLQGFRYLQFDEDLSLSQNIALTFLPGDGSQGDLDGTPGSPLNINTLDLVECTNRWYGYQVGGTFEWACGPCFLAGFAKFGIGGMRQEVQVSGLTVSGGDGNPTVITGGGVFSSDPVERTFTRTRIAGIMEGSISVGYAFSPAIRTYVGFDYLYIMRVARPTNQVVGADGILTANVGGVDGNTAVFNGTVPNVRFNDRDMWVQGIHFGMEFRY